MVKNKKIPDYEYNQVANEKSILEKEVRLLDRYGYGYRHIQLLIFLLCLTVNFINRAHLGVTIVAMTSDAAVNSDFNATVIPRTVNVTDKLTEDDNLTINVTDGSNTRRPVNSSDDMNGTEIHNQANHITFNWPKSIQEMVLNAFFLGYAVMMFPMGVVCQRFGGKLPLQIALLLNAVVSIATPWLILKGGWKAVCFCRILQGVSQAGTYPCIQTLLAKWLPATERASLGSIVYSGLNVGTVAGFQIAGFLGGSRWGWSSTFYAIGLISFLAFIILSVFGSTSPNEHKTISEEEKMFIMGASDNSKTKRNIKTQWRAIFTSRPLWGTITTHIGCTIGFIFFFNQVPSYIHYILGEDVRNSGLLSSLPYIASIITTLGFGWISDYCTNRSIITMTNARRICNTISNFGLAAALILTSYTNNTLIAVICLIVGLGCTMGAHCGWMINYIDLAPNFSGTLTAIGNTFSNTIVTLVPIIVTYLVTDMTNVIQWRIMFFIIAFIILACNAVFVCLISTDVQSWNYALENDTCVEDQNETVMEKINKN